MMSDEDIDDVDRRALEAAVALMSRDRDYGEQIRWQVANREWIDAAIFAAFVSQIKHLGLRPWDTAPVDAAVDQSPAGRLLANLFRAGLSRFEPDPIAALAAAARKNSRTE